MEFPEIGNHFVFFKTIKGYGENEISPNAADLIK